MLVADLAFCDRERGPLFLRALANVANLKCCKMFVHTLK